MNEPCSFENQCRGLKESLDKRLIRITENRLYNIRFGLDRKVDYGLYKALRFYRRAIRDICEDNTCNYCYGNSIENVLEKARIISN